MRGAFALLLLGISLVACSRSELEAELEPELEPPMAECTSCADAGCEEGRILCGGRCVDPLDDPLDCGACQHACSPGAQCVGGKCRTSCDGGTTACGSECVDLSSDPQNCGACDVPCLAGASCSAGVCTFGCGEGQLPCPDPSGGFTCVTTASDPQNCGACGHACPTGLECIASTCELVCPAGLIQCSSPDGSESCVDTSADPQNCAACGFSCALPNVEKASCVSGTCGISTCAAGNVDCDSTPSNGCECKATACAAGKCGKRVFVTSQLFTADLGGASGADAKCQALADAAELGGTYMAWLSDFGSSPSTRFTHANVPYLRVDGIVVANDWADLTDLTLAAPINVTELGTAPPVGTECYGVCAWTNTWVNGTFWADFSSCDNWTSTTAYSGFLGKFDATNWYWSLWCQAGCNGTAPLYCFEQ